MKKKDTCDITYAKKLAHLFPESEWWWNDNGMGKPFIAGKDPSNPLLKTYPAPSTMDLLERLPQYVNKREYMFTIVKNDRNEYWVGYPDANGICHAFKRDFVDASLPQALALCLAWLDKEGLLKEE